LFLSLCAAAALVAVVAIAYMVARTMAEARPAVRQIGLWEFLRGTAWDPAAGKFGALPAIYGTLVTSAIAMVIAVPLAVAVAIATTVILPRRLRGAVASLIDLLAAIPSVVYGLWAIIVLVPAVKPVFGWIARHNLGIGALEGPVLGRSLLLASVVLAVMILPIITAVVREVLVTVPIDQREAALALGATRWEMVRGSMLPWARSGIVGASALGLGRAVGETIAVAMVLGSQPTILKSLLGPGQTLAGTIAFEYNSAIDKTHASSLVAMAVVLFIVAFMVNLAARLLVTPRVGTRRRSGILRRLMQRGIAPVTAVVARLTARTAAPVSPLTPPPSRPLVPRIGLSRRWRSRLAEVAVGGALVVSIIPLVLVIAYAIAKGSGALSADFFTSDGEPDIAGNGIKHALVGTLIMMGIATIVAVPLGLLTAFFMRECQSQGPILRRVASWLGTFVDVLLGVPSIVAGLIVAIVVVLAMGSFSALAGGLSLAVIMFPIVVRSTDEILRLVPGAQVEAALALGAPRWRTAWSVVLPAAAPGIVTGIMLALARVSGETAPLILTASGAQFSSTDVFDAMTALPLYIFNGTINSTVPVAQEHAWGAALILVMLVLGLNFAARLVARMARTGELR
jgi:phosphate transport system permease protein